MEFDLSKIKFSHNDLKSCITIPNRLTSELAEFIGIVVGDGHVGLYKSKKGNKPFTHYELKISGNIKDIDYYVNHVDILAYNLFHVKFSINKQKNEESVMLSKNSKAIYFFLSKVIMIPQIKDKISIPACIKNDSIEIKSSFLRGLADADFTLSIKNKEGKPYPSVQGSSKSEELIKGVCLILKEMDICYTSFFDKNYSEKRNWMR